MYTFGLWNDLAWLLVVYNMEHQVFSCNGDIVVDPTHLDAFASVHRTCGACVTCPKAQSCQFQQDTCDMTGIVSKSKNLKLPGVKLNLACLPGSEIVIAALAGPGQRHDSQIFQPHPCLPI